MRFLCYTLLSIVAHAQVAVTTATDWPDAVSKAKAEGKDIAVLLDGSDWSPIATSFQVSTDKYSITFHVTQGTF